MEVQITWQGVILAASVLGAAGAISAAVAKAVRWFDERKVIKRKLTALEEKHDRDMTEERREMQLLVYGILCCLKGLKEKGCNGPVTEAISKLEKHLNAKAHE